MTPPVPDRLPPLRWRWILLTTRHQEARFLYWPPQEPTGLRRLGMFDQRGYDIGVLVWRMCDDCRIGSIAKISIALGHQRQGLGRRLVRRALADGPDYAWRTSGQSPDAKPFFAALGREADVAFAERAGSCEHLKSHGYRPSPPGRRPRPALERDI
jgi:GNAT superfamily N-acetyltransferase